MIPLNNHTHYSLLQGYCKPAKLAKLAGELEYNSIAISDIDSLSGTVNFMDSLEKTGIKPIIGTKLPYVDGGYIFLIAKNLTGWRELICLNQVITSGELINDPMLKTAKNCVCITGDVGSTLFSYLVKQNSVFASTNPTHSLSFYLRDEYNRVIYEHLSKLKTIFKDDLYVGIQRCNQVSIPIDKIAADIFEYNASCVGIKTVALNNTFVHKESEMEELQILLCSKEKSKFASVKDRIQTDEKANLYRFFNDKNFALYSKDYYKQIYSPEQIAVTQEISDKIENFTLLANPKAPNFVCPDGMSQKDYLLHLCRAGWQRILPRIDQNRTQEYVDRIKHELDVINRAAIEGYFLVVQDYVNWAKNEGMLVGCGRGCFTPDSRVKMSDGLFCPISLVNIGDRIIDAYGFIQTVYDILEYDISEEIVELEFENGKIIRCTKDHMFLTDRGWVEAINLTEDDNIKDV